MSTGKKTKASKWKGRCGLVLRKATRSKYRKRVNRGQERPPNPTEIKSRQPGIWKKRNKGKAKKTGREQPGAVSVDDRPETGTKRRKKNRETQATRSCPNGSRAHERKGSEKQREEMARTIPEQNLKTCLRRRR